MKAPNGHFDPGAVVTHFQPRIEYARALPFGSGHINDTFLVHTQDEKGQKYILQRINRNIFRDVPGLMHNIGCISEHIISKLKAGITSPFRPECYTFLESDQAKNYYQDREGNFWRMTPFIENSRSYDLIDSPDKASNGGVAYGEFLLLLHDLSPDLLTETIPDFHNVEYRLDSLMDAVEKDPARRAALVSEEIRFLEHRREEMKRILQAGRRGELPLRITHNDTKFNNILFDEEDDVIGVIDLDTVMPGYMLYDFGDAIRTGASTAEEDERDTGRMEMDPALFEAFTAGYLSKTRAVLTKTEIDYLPLSAKLLTYIMAVRFLTDYLLGDTYYKTQFSEHNLVRTRSQIKLLRSMEAQYNQMVALVNQYARE